MAYKDLTTNVFFAGASVTPIFCLLLTITALKATISTIQVLAYHPKFHESVFEPAQDGQTATESSLVDPSRDPRLVTGDSAAIEEEEDDDDAECQKKKRTVYDWPSTLLRFKRLLPFMLPGSSRLSYALIGASHPLRSRRYFTCISERILPHSDLYSPGSDCQCCSDLTATAIWTYRQRSCSSQIAVAQVCEVTCGYQRVR